tara:strand:- start:465 stop:860 length:396 start_codon:yes stop_codon:yes gene_type:complete
MKVFYYRKEEKKHESGSTEWVNDGHVDYFYIPEKSLALSKRERPLQSQSDYSITTDSSFLEVAKKMLLGNGSYGNGVGGFMELDIKDSEVDDLITSFQEKEKLELKVQEGMVDFFKKVDGIVEERMELFSS